MNPFKISVFLFVFVSFLSCKKDKEYNSVGGAINITNVVTNGGSLVLKSDQSMASLPTSTISNNASLFLPLPAGKTYVNVFEPAVSATSNMPAKQAVTYFNQQLQVSYNSNYSLFLAGSSTSNIESVLIDEKYLRTYPDSLCGVRFINLSPGSPAISVNLKNAANGSEVSNLAYKSYSDFKTYPAKRATPSYSFEFRNAGTGALITSYTLVTPYFHNVTLVLRGIVGGSPAAGITLNNDY